MLRRQLLFLAAGFVGAVITEHYLGTPACICCAVMILLARAFSGNSERTVLIARLLFISFLVGAAVYGIQDNHLQSQQDTIMARADSDGFCTISGRVREQENRTSESGDKYVQFTLESDKGRLLVKYYGKEMNAIPGDMISITGSVDTPSGRRNPGCFDYGLYLKSRRISVIMTAASITVTDDNAGRHPAGKLYLIKEAFIECLRKSADSDTAAMMRAIMFGNKGDLDEEVLETFQRNGTAHILAVSGLHIGIIYGFIAKLWALAGRLTGGFMCVRKGVAFFIFNAAFFTCYMVMSDFSPSVVRAVIMVMLHVFAQLTNRRYDLGCGALTVMLLVLVKNPMMLFNVGFQMSFLAVLTLMLMLPFVGRFYSGVFLSGIVIQLGLGMFILYNFNYLSLMSVIINVPVISLAGIIVPAGLVCMACTGLPAFDACAKAVQALCILLRWVNDAGDMGGITSFQIPGPPLWLLAFYYMVLLTLASEEGRLALIRAGRIGVNSLERLRIRFRHAVKICAVLLMVSVAFAYVSGDHFEKCNLTFVDVGQGDCICIRAGGTYLVDGGGNANYNLGKKTLKSYLLKNGMSDVDGAFVTHLHTDHYKGICELCREGMVKKLFVYDGNRMKEDQILEETGLKSENIEYVCSGQTIELNRGGLFNRHSEYIEILWPSKKTDSEYSDMLEKEEDENAMSLIFRVHFSNRSLFGSRKETTLLITGDMGEDGEEELISREGKHLETDILKIGHHGSKYSSTDDFLDVVAPGYAVIQVGKNNYGHPAPETIEKLKSRGIVTYRNDTSGAVGFEIEKGVLKNVVTIAGGGMREKKNIG